MPTTDNTRIVALIERAERETPFCECGEPMAAVAEDSQIWLDCTAHQSRPEGRVRRFLANLSAIGHTRLLIVDPA
ncbi:MAG TPA: hypothetical protein VND88_00470 [Candidatus Acidoferrales bacterium]|nr:hypothetical protein [Candidatus Acidoferrales bacterium]